MNDNRRLNKLYLMVLILTSVFLCISCGEPSYCDLTKSGVTRKTGSQSDNIEFEFSVYCDDSDIEKVKNGPGLLIGYIALDSSDSNIKQVIDSLKDNSTYPTRYLEDEFEDITIGRFSLNDNLILKYDYKYSDPNYYTIKLLSPKICNSEGNQTNNAGSPTFHYNFDTNHNFSENFKIEYKKQINNNSQSLLSVSTDDNSNFYILLENANIENINNNVFVLFASLTSGTGDFSNTYFSDLTNIGFIDLTNL